MTAGRQKNRGKKRKEWMRACEKRFKYKPEVTRQKRRKNPSTKKEKGTAKEEETKQMEPKPKFLLHACELRIGLSSICSADKYFHSVFTDTAIIKIHFPNCWCVFKPRIYNFVEVF